MLVKPKKVIKKPQTIEFYIKQFFTKHPNQDIQQQKVVEYVWKFRKSMDTWRGVRGLYEKGWLRKFSS